MTTPKKLSELDPRALASGHVVRLRDGEPPRAIHGYDLEGWKELIADHRVDDRFYLVPRIEFTLRPLAPMPFERPDDVRYLGMRMRSQVIEKSYSDPLRNIRRLRDEFAIELDDHRFPSEALKPIDDPADRFAQLELDKPEDAP